MRLSFSINEMSESDFKRTELPILFEDRLLDRSFAIISDGKNAYKFGWQSTDIKPVIVWINGTICSIGIDLIFIIFDFVTGKIIKKILLDYFFYDIKILNKYLYVITELELIRIGISNFTIDKKYALSDYFESIELKGESILIKSVDGRVINLLAQE